MKTTQPLPLNFIKGKGFHELLAHTELEYHNRPLQNEGGRRRRRHTAEKLAVHLPRWDRISQGSVSTTTPAVQPWLTPTRRSGSQELCFARTLQSAINDGWKGERREPADRLIQKTGEAFPSQCHWRQHLDGKCNRRGEKEPAWSTYTVLQDTLDFHQRRVPARPVNKKVGPSPTCR